MARKAIRMYGPALLTNSAATKITVPASTKYVIRQIHLQNNDASAHTVTISIGADAAGTRLLDAFSLAAKAAGVQTSMLDLFGYWVMDAAEILQALADANSVVNITIFGDELTAG